MISAKSFPTDYFVLDGLYVINRAFHATPPFTSPKGLPTGAIHGFLGSTLSAMEALRPKVVVMAGEGGHLARDERQALASDYKATRPAFDPALQVQIPLIFDICRLLGWPVIMLPGLEADDVIASIAWQCAAAAKVVFTTDKDILSLVNAHLRIYSKTKGKCWLAEAADITQAWGVAPMQIPEVLALCGDSIDNVPGIRGIGRTTAIKLIREFGSIANIYASLPQLKPALQTLLVNGRQACLSSMQLIQLRPQEIPEETLRPGKPDWTALRTLLLDDFSMVQTWTKLSKLQEQATESQTASGETV